MSALRTVRSRSRQPLVRAAIDLSATAGFSAVNVTQLCAVAGVTSRTFYNNFADLADVFFEACLQMHGDLRRAIEAAHAAEVGVAGRLVVDDVVDVPIDASGGGSVVLRARAQACVEALVSFVFADPVRAQALFVQSYAAGPAVAALRSETVSWLISLVGGCGGSGGGPDPVAARPLMAEMAVGGISDLLFTCINAGDWEGLSDLVPLFVDTIVRVHEPRAG